jgi:hypothetical protein
MRGVEHSGYPGSFPSGPLMDRGEADAEEASGTARGPLQQAKISAGRMIPERAHNRRLISGCGKRKRGGCGCSIPFKN